MQRQQSANLNANPISRDQSQYTGPIVVPNAQNEILVQRFNECYVVACTTNGSGVIDLAFGNTPTLLNDWSGLQAVWNEYRILGIELEYMPVKNIANWAYGVAHTVVDHKASAALGGIAAASEHESYEMKSLFQSWKRTAKSSSFEEMSFIDTSSPAASYYIKVYSSGNTTSQTIGYFALRYLLEFRGKK